VTATSSTLALAPGTNPVPGPGASTDTPAFYLGTRAALHHPQPGAELPLPAIDGGDAP
jgi:hypothetical protein